MREKTELKLMFWFTIGYFTIFTILAVIKRNYEFLFYTVILSIIIFILIRYRKGLRLTKYVLLGLTILGALHIFGGNLYFLGTRLYDTWLIMPNILKYDQAVHVFGIFIATFAVHNLLGPDLNKKIKNKPLILSLVLITIAMGIGAFSEIMELFAVVFFNAAKQVGGYLNNALDLVFNLIGSIIACLFITKKSKRKKL